MIELADKSILARSDAALALWLFAQGDESQETNIAVRRALLRAINGTGAPLHILLGVPRCGMRWRLHVRDCFLHRASLLVPAKYTTHARIAARMLEVTPDFIRASANAWDIGYIPSTATDFERLLFLAYKTEISIPRSLRQWQKIISMK